MANPSSPGHVELSTMGFGEIDEIEEHPFVTVEMERREERSSMIEEPSSMREIFGNLGTGANQLHAPASFWTQTNALFRKNLTFQKRRKKETGLLFLIQVLLCGSLALTRHFLSSKAKEAKQFPPEHSCSDAELLNSFSACPIRHPYEYPPLLLIPDSDDRAVQTAFLPLADLPPSSCKKNQSCAVTVLFTGSNKSLALDLAGRFFPRNSILNSSDDILNSFANGVFGSTSERIAFGPYLYLDPAFHSNNPIHNIQRHCLIKCIKGLRLWRNLSSTINDELFKGFPDGNSEKMTNEIVAAYDFLNSGDKIFNVSIWYKPSMYEGIQGKPNAVKRVARSVNLASNTYLEFLRGPNFKILFEFVKEMPKHPDSPLIDDVVSKYYPQFFTAIVLDLILVMLTNLVNEKEENTRIMMKMHGLGDGTYLVISYVFFLALSLVYTLCFVATCLAMGLGSFKEHDFSLQLVFIFVYINLQIAFCFLVARMFSKVRTTSVVSYPIVFATGLVGKFCLAAKVGDPSFPRYLATVMELYPGLALYRVFLEFSEKASEARFSHNGGMTWEDLNDGSNGMKEVMIIMLTEWFVFLVVSYCLDNKSSIFCFLRKPSSFSLLSYSDQAEKDDIAQERQRVEEFVVCPNQNYSIICYYMNKVYPGKDGNPPKVAVNELSLALPRGECFGILGPNGAGKSSFIKMMIGLTQPSSGTAFIEGQNIRTHMESVYTSMGVCPEHDLLWETLTAREHLLFYGRLKNLKGSALDQAVEESLSSVNLLNGGVADKQAGKYSRGMKRRLSLAISLIGDPKVVYMDELSTGLDPASRSELWNIVKHAKGNRAIILTSTLLPLK